LPTGGVGGPGGDGGIEDAAAEVLELDINFLSLNATTGPSDRLRVNISIDGAEQLENEGAKLAASSMRAARVA
jgi:hypothetical protein